MKITGYRHKMSGRIILPRRWQWTVIGTPYLRKEYINKDSIFVFSKSNGYYGKIIGLHPDFDKIDLLDYEKEIIPHLTKDAEIKPIDFKKAKISRLLVNRMGFKEERIDQALHSGCSTIEEVGKYLRARGYKQARFL